MTPCIYVPKEIIVSILWVFTLLHFYSVEGSSWFLRNTVPGYTLSLRTPIPTSVSISDPEGFNLQEIPRSVLEVSGSAHKAFAGLFDPNIFNFPCIMPLFIRMQPNTLIGFYISYYHLYCLQSTK
jgi:hypothetical protein